MIGRPVAAEAAGEPAPASSAPARAVDARRRVLRLVCGMPLVSVGIAAMLRSRLGAAPFDVLTSGLAARTPLSVGTAFLVLTAVAVVAGVLLRVRPGPGTLGVVLLVGPGVDLALGAIPAPGTLLPRVALLAAGLGVMCLGIALIVSSDLGPGPTEILMVGLARWLGVRRARWAIDAACVLGGWPLGGAAGVGTVITLVATGPVLAWLLTRLRRQSPARGTAPRR